MELDSYQSPEAEALLRAGRDRQARDVTITRERVTHVIAATGFVVAAALLAGLAPWDTSLSVTTLLAAVAVYLVAEFVRFPVGSGWTVPTQLAFVPMLFVLPTPLVPLIASGGVLLARTPDLLRGRASLGRTLASFGDSWYALGPALVLVLAGDQRFAWSEWPIYLAAFAAQILLDLAATAARCWFAERIDPRVQLPLLTWIWIVDAVLSIVGLMIAAVAVGRPGLILLSLPVMALLALFARERRERLDQMLALGAAYRGTALLLADVVEADDAYTGSHSRGVLELALAVGDALALNPSQRRSVEFAALLHDVGKIRVPNEIITKPGPLDEEEWAIMRRHTLEGEAMLRRVGGVLEEVGRIVRSCHESYDGRGYPDGLAGTAIPIEARIVAACDAYSAMTTDRSYRLARSPEEALIELRRCAGAQFDPQVVEALCALIEDHMAPLPEQLGIALA